MSGIEESSFNFLDLNYCNSVDNKCKNFNYKHTNQEAKDEHECSDKNPNNNLNESPQNPLSTILKTYKLRFVDQGKLLVCTECEIILVSGSFDYHLRTFHGVNLTTNERSTLLLTLNQMHKSLFVEPLAYTELQEHLTTNLHFLDYIPGLSLIQGYRCTKCNLGESTVGLLHQSHRHFNIFKCSDYKNFIKSKIQLICSDFKKFGHGIKSLNQSQFIPCAEMKNSKLESPYFQPKIQIHSDQEFFSSKSFSKEATNGNGKEVINLSRTKIFFFDLYFRGDRRSFESDSGKNYGS